MLRVMDSPAALLSVEGLTVQRGGGDVVAGLNLQLPAGKIVAIVGRNGAGKTTVLETIAGLLQPRDGSVTLRGSRLTGLSAHRIARLGVALAPEGRQLFPHMTVYENLLIGATCGHRSLRTVRHTGLARVWELFPDLYRFKSRKARELSGGQQQMVAVGRALAAEPTVLMLDEPTFGLSPSLTEQMCGHLSMLRGESSAVLIAEQSIDVALDVADDVGLLLDGKIAEFGDPRSITNSPNLQATLFA